MDFSSFSVNQTWKHAESIHLYHGATFFTTVFFFFFNQNQCMKTKIIFREGK